MVNSCTRQVRIFRLVDGACHYPDVVVYGCPLAIEIAQLQDGFCNFAEGHAKWDQGFLGEVKVRFERVVPPFVFSWSKLWVQMVHVSALHDSEEGREGSPVLTAGA
ncbi:MAG: hypothetical protein JWM91_5078 [Rhodospirillales bacterium]|nr:hypothetical protein [Rhodospirillales bacterium]